MKSPRASDSLCECGQSSPEAHRQQAESNQQKQSIMSKSSSVPFFIENRLTDTAGEEESGTKCESSIDIYTRPCVKQIASGKLLYSTGSSARFPGGVEWGWVGKEAQQGGVICILNADLCCCTVVQRKLPGGGHGNPLQYSCLENPHGQRSLGVTVHGVTKRHTQLSD